MTDAEFQTLIDAANARIGLQVDQSFAKVKEDIRSSFQQAHDNMNARFDALAKELVANMTGQKAHGIVQTRAEQNLSTVSLGLE